MGLALFLTFFVMGPVFDKIYEDAYQPYADNRITMTQALERESRPCGPCAETNPGGRSGAVRKTFRHAAAERPEDVPLRVLVPAFATRAENRVPDRFHGIHPLLIIDMVVASVLMSMGMMMVSPVLVALPFKIMLFVLVDGWHMLIGSLAESFY